MAAQNKTANRLQNILSIGFIIVVVVLLGWLSTRYVATADWTANNSNSLTEPSKRMLDHMQGPISVVAWVYPDQVIRKSIRDQFKPYMRYSDKLSIKFMDPAKHPQQARKLNVTASGMVFIKYEGRKESLKALSEQTITTALQRLAGGGERWVVFLEGHGERGIDDKNEAGYTQIAAQLRNKGLKVRGLNLAKSPTIPDNTSVLVIASPQNELLSGEVKLIKQYVDKGGNLLWLADPGSLNGLKPLADDINIEWLNGTLIYPDFQIMGTSSPAVALVMDYPKQAINYALSNITVFPFARGILKIDRNGNMPDAWTAKPFLATPKRTWSESSKLGGTLKYEPNKGDTLGPFMVGLALDRLVPFTEEEKAKRAKVKITPDVLEKRAKAKKVRAHQRIVAVGDSDFLSNGFLETLGNHQLGLNIFQWVTSRDAQISIDVPAAPDNKLFLAPWAPRIYALIFVVAMPLLLVGIGVGRWWLRRRR